MAQVAVFPLEQKRKELPFVILKLITGARVAANFESNSEVVSLTWNDEVTLLNIVDFKICQQIASEIWKEQVEAKVLLPSLQSLQTSMFLLKCIIEKVNDHIDNKHGNKKKIIMIRDNSGCGYWRMSIPNKYMDLSKYVVDVSQMSVVYDWLLEYDTIVVQRLYDWAQYYVLERLKKVGKKIVYDIDDDIFNIPAHNLASKAYGIDALTSAKNIMKIADVITTTTEILKQRLGFENKTVVIPNSIDLDDGYVKMTGVDAIDTTFTGIGDGFKRIFWQGSPTHEVDWYECVEAIHHVLTTRDNVRLVILGYMPKILEKMVASVPEKELNKRIEFQPFVSTESYIELCKKTRAEVSIAPLEETVFNSGKSCIKWVEAASMCSPMVASNVSPYKEVIEHGVNGFLVKGKEQWVECIEKLLDDSKLRLQIVKNARKTINETYDIKKNVNQWQDTF